MKNLDVLVIGSGPAGNTAAIYTIRSGFRTAIITGECLGGQLTITTEVENFPGFPEPIYGSELMDRMLQQSKNLGVEVIYDKINNIDFSKRPFVCSTENNETIITTNIVIATGAKTKWLNVKGEKEFLGYGVSGCAVCDGGFFRKKTVAVIGGGESAGIEALHLSNLASNVYIIYRKNSLQKISNSIINKIKSKDNIKVIYNTEVTEIKGQGNPKKVTSLKLVNNESNLTSELNVDGVFVAIGRSPETELFKNSNLNINENGYIITEKDSTRTNIKNVYAVGDVADKKFKQAIVAAGYGCIAGLEIQEDN